MRLRQGSLALDWDWFEDENRLAETWPRFMPLLEEDALVEANVPYDAWLHEATGRGVNDVVWLIERFEALPLSDKEKAELYDGQKIYVRWTPPHRATRTGMKLPVRKIFFHRAPLIQRRDLSFRDELEAPPVPLKRLSQKQGAAILELIRETSTLRYLQSSRISLVRSVYSHSCTSRLSSSFVRALLVSCWSSTRVSRCGMRASK